MSNMQGRNGYKERRIEERQGLARYGK